MIFGSWIHIGIHIIVLRFLIRKYKHKLDWRVICFANLPESFIRKFCDYVDWDRYWGNGDKIRCFKLEGIEEIN